MAGAAVQARSKCVMEIEKYVGKTIDCPCGKKHTFFTKAIEIGSGITKNTGKILRENGFSDRLLLVADENTLSASKGVVESLEEAGFILKKQIYKNMIYARAEQVDELIALSGGTGFDDVFVYAPVPAVVELGDAILGFDGSLNFFAGPLDKKFSANFNFYNVHYAQHHVSGTSGSTPEDMRDIVKLLGENRLDPSVMITHIGGIDAAIDTTVNLPKIPGGKKLIYTHIELPLTALTDFERLGEKDARFKTLDELVKANNGLWSAEAEKYLLENFK
jgi:hypothetical protein